MGTLWIVMDFFLPKKMVQGTEKPLTLLHLLLEKKGKTFQNCLLESSLRLYGIAIQCRLSRRFTNEQIAIVCCYIACRLEKQELSLTDIKNNFRVNRISLSSLYWRLCKFFRLDEQPVYQVAGDPYCITNHEESKSEKEDDYYFTSKPVMKFYNCLKKPDHGNCFSLELPTSNSNILKKKITSFSNENKKIKNISFQLEILQLISGKLLNEF